MGGNNKKKEKKEQSVSIDENEYTDCTCEVFSK